MSVPYLREAAHSGDSERLIRFVRIHLSDGNEIAVFTDLSTGVERSERLPSLALIESGGRVAME
jgi:hypothetical protein